MVSFVPKEKTTEVVTVNDTRYRWSTDKYRKLCKLTECNRFSCGEYCLNHIPDVPGLKRCIQCQRQKKPEHFFENEIEYARCTVCLQKSRRAAKKLYSRKQNLLLDLKQELGGKCVDCGIDDLEVLEFDHIDPTQKVNCVRRIYNVEGIKAEAKKCELRCVNCHAIKTHSIERIYSEGKGAEYRKQARDYVNEIKMCSTGCEECGWFKENQLYVLQFDHIDQSLKEEIVARLVACCKPLPIIKKEIDKCRLLCANCHRKHTLRQMNYNIVQLIEQRQTVATEAATIEVAA